MGAVMVDMSEGLRWNTGSQPSVSPITCRSTDNTDSTGQLTNMCSAGAGGSGINGAIGATSIGRTSCASGFVFPAAAMGDADRARKDSSSRAVTRPVELHVEPASLLFGNMPGVVSMRVDVGSEGRMR